MENIEYEYKALDIDLLGTYGSIAAMTTILNRLQPYLCVSIETPMYARCLNNIVNDYWFWLV